MKIFKVGILGLVAVLLIAGGLFIVGDNKQNLNNPVSTNTVAQYRHLNALATNEVEANFEGIDTNEVLSSQNNLMPFGGGGLQDRWFTNININMPLPRIPQYGQFFLNLLPGDIILDKNAALGFGHTSIVEGWFYDVSGVGYWRLVESIGGVGVVRSVLDDYRIRVLESYILRVNATQAQRQAAVSFAVSQLRVRYSLHFTKPTNDNPNGWMCSTLVWWTYRRQNNRNGIHLGNPLLPSVLPMDIYRSTHTSAIESHRNSMINTQGFQAGAGTITNPFQVRTPQQLYNMRRFQQSHFRMMNGIGVSGFGNWRPISMFLGTFDGGGFEISGLNIGIAAGTVNHYYGFIGILGGTVRNLTIRGDITATRQHAARTRDVNVGMIAGVSPGDIINATVHGSINVDRIHARVGGISGDNSGGVIHNSRNNASIRSAGNIGGITADNTGTITQSFNNASIIFDPTGVARNVGGITGFNWNSVRNNGNYGGIEIFSPMNTPSRLGMVIGYNRTTPFDTTNYNRGTAFHRGGVSFGNDQFAFRQFAGRVGFQQGIAAPAPTPVPPPPTPVPPPPTPPSNCVADGTLITLANGSQVRVEDLTGDEMLLVWDFRTGTFTSAPIMFIDNDAREYKEVAKLSFANGNYVKIIDAHGFFSTTLNKYVRITTYNAYQFVGQYFLKHSAGENNMTMERVRLVDTDVFMHYTASWNPIAPNHFAFFANGMLSAPGLFVRMGFLNVFMVDTETLAFCQISYITNIEMFGLLTFEQFNQIMPGLPEVFFYAFNGQYLQIKMGRGLITWDDINELVERYGALLAA